MSKYYNIKTGEILSNLELSKMMKEDGIIIDDWKDYKYE